MRQLLDEAAKGGYGVGAFNVNDMEQIQAIMMAAKETNSPVIVQASRGARKFAEDKYLFHLILAAAELNPQIPIAMHQDHGNSFETCKSAIELGFTSVMMDGSLKDDGKTPTSFEENVEVTRRVVDYAHERGVTVEGEIGVLGGVEDGHGAGGSGLEHITDPDQAVEFAERTGVDALAIAIGTSHGAYKFTKKPDGSVLKMDVLIAIHKRLPHTHLVMHGSSSVPKELQDIVGDDAEKLRTFPFEPEAFSDFVKQLSGGNLSSKPSEILIRLQKAAQRAMRNGRRTITSKIIDDINSEGL